MVPAAFVRLAELPLSPNGKLDRKALPAPEIQAYSTRGYEPPQGDMEIKGAAIWADILKLDKVGRHDNFFDLGGHSVMVVRVVTRLRQVLSRALEMRDLFAHPELSDLASVLENAPRAVLQPITRAARGRQLSAVTPGVASSVGSTGRRAAPRELGVAWNDQQSGKVTE
jgi:acyl carrier protein